MDAVTRARPRPVVSRTAARPAPGAGADPIAAAKKALEADLARPLPEVPADKAGKEQWLEDARIRESALKKQLTVLRDAWFDGKLSFDEYTALSHKEFEFEARISRVARSLEAPAPKPPAAPGGDSGPEYLTPELLGAMEKHPDNPLNIFGVMFLPITLIVDGMTGLAKLTGGLKAPAKAEPAKEEKK